MYKLIYYLIIFILNFNLLYSKIDIPEVDKNQKWTESYEDPVLLAKDVINQTRPFWGPLGYHTISAQLNIGFNAVQYGGAYILLESPKFVVDLVTGGFVKVAGSISYDFIIEIIESSVNTPQKISKRLSRAMMFKGFEEYKISYKIAREYLENNILTRSEAIEFLESRWGIFKMSNANLLQSRSRNNNYTIEDQISEIAVNEMMQIFEKNYKQYLGINDRLPLLHTAKFIRDINQILLQKNIGLADYPPYISFLKNNDMLNRLVLKEKMKWGKIQEYSLKDVFAIIENGDLDSLRYYFNKYYIDPNSIQDWEKKDWYEDNYSLLYNASIIGHLDIVKYLVQKGADVNIRNKNSFARARSTPLIIASSNNHLEIVKYLLKNGAKVNLCTGLGSPLYKAASSGNTKVVIELLKNGADPNYGIRGKGGPYVIWIAASNGHYDIVKFLYESGSRFEKGNYSALRIAASKGFFNIVKYLVEKGADVNFGNNGYKPLDKARKNNQTKIINYLIDNGAK